MFLFKLSVRETASLDLQVLSQVSSSKDLSPKTVSQSSKWSKKSSNPSNLEKFLPPPLGWRAENPLGKTAPSTEELQAKEFAWKQTNSYYSDLLSDSAGMDKQQIQFVGSLWKEINDSIVESPYLSEYGHVGKVFLRFEVDKNGELLEGSLRASADDHILKVFAARAVRKAIKEKRYVFPIEKMIVNTQFSWAGYEDCRSQRGIHQNFLSFCKYGEDKRKTFSNSEKMATYLKALSFGFGAAEAIKEYKKEEFRRNVNFDPFEEIRRDPDYNLSS